MFLKQMKAISINLKSILYNSKESIESLSTIYSSDLIVNTTPVGMLSNGTHGEMPLGKSIWDNFSSDTILYDLIYGASPTAWLSRGKLNNNICIDGLEMLIHQGAASLKLWSNKTEIPLGIMRQSALNAINL